MGETTGPDCDRAWLTFAGEREGAANATGRVAGCYMHGIFASDAFRNAYLSRFGAEALMDYESGVDETLDTLADHIETYFDLDTLLELAEPVGPPA